METRTLREGDERRDGDEPSASTPGADAPTVAEDQGVPEFVEEIRRSRERIGAQIGRFVVLEPLGAGGMGAVYAAYDKKLDRKVALKVLHPERAPSKEHQARMVREARALARLSHPSVVAIYDVGTHEGQVYLAMEFVEGATLRQWLTAQRRSWREVLGVFLRLAEGLQGIHDLGLVHRDFKPDNVLIDARGRPRLIDFGLARRAGEAEPSFGATTQPDEASVDERLTVTGALIGTPRYMAPEQFEREPATAASDQFAFCVALYEAVFGAEPFKGDSVETRAKSVLRDEVRAPKARRGAPKELFGLIKRGMERRAEARWPSLKDLAAALRRLLETYDEELENPDARRGRRLTMITLAFFILLGPGSATLASLSGVLEITPARLALGDAVFSALVISALLSLRKHWIDGRLGSRLAVLAMMLGVLFTLNDTSGWLVGRSAADSSLTNLVALTVIALFASLLTNTALLVAGGWSAIMAAVAIYDPERSFAYLNLGVLGTVVITWALTPRRAGVGWVPSVFGSTLGGVSSSQSKDTTNH